MASRGLRIFGSGTLSIWTRPVPCQQSAFMGFLLLAPGGLTLRGGDLARLHLPLEPAQVLTHLDVRLLAEQPGQGGADLPAGRVVLQANVDLGAAPAGGRPEVDAAGRVHVRAGERPPGDQLVFALVDDLSVPLDAAA